jgi:cytochrome c oxidase assembly protein Cox11
MNVCCPLESYEIERGNNGAKVECFCFINDRFAPNINCNMFTL